MPTTSRAGEAPPAFGTRIGPPKSRPLPKKKPHRRSPHACDECRLRKRACDSVDPCGPCRNSGLECTYHFRRPVPPPTLRIRNLQDHLRLARSWLQEVQKKAPDIPGMDLEKCVRLLDLTLPEDQPLSPSSASPGDHGSRQAALSNMLAGRDRFVDVGPGTTCFYGAYSELSFILRTLELFQQGSAVPPEKRLLVVSNLFSLPLPPPQTFQSGLAASFPSHDDVLALVDVVLSKNHPMLCFLSEQHVNDVARGGLAASPDKYVPLLHLILALGYLFDPSRHRGEGCRDTLHRATDHFHMGVALLKPMEVNDITSLQTLVCAVVFLVSTSRITAAHPLIGTACSSVLRLGLHALGSNPLGTTPAEGVSRVRLLATVMRLDLFASLVLALPPFLHRDAVPPAQIARLASEAEAERDLVSAAALRQVCLLAIPLSKRVYGYSDPAYIDVRHFEEVQNEFHCWKVEASGLLASLGQSKEHRIIKHDLEMTYNLGHIVLFRPFLHYLRTMADGGGTISVAQSYPSLACIKLASSTIVQAHEATARLDLNLAGLWPSVYTVFLCVMCLIFLIAAHHGTSRPSRAWQRAAMGIRIIAAFRCADDCSSRCLEVLKLVMAELSHTVYFDIDEIEASVVSNCVASTTTSTFGTPSAAWGSGGGALSLSATEAGHDSRAVAGPSHVLLGSAAAESASASASASDRNRTVGDPDYRGGTGAGGEMRMTMQDGADRMLVQAEELSTEFDFHDLLHLSDHEE